MISKTNQRNVKRAREGNAMKSKTDVDDLEFRQLMHLFLCFYWQVRQKFSGDNGDDGKRKENPKKSYMIWCCARTWRLNRRVPGASTSIVSHRFHLFFFAAFSFRLFVVLVGRILQARLMHFDILANDKQTRSERERENVMQIDEDISIKNTIYFV